VFLSWRPILGQVAGERPRYLVAPSAPPIRTERLQGRQRRRRLPHHRRRCLQPQQPYSCDPFGKAAIASRHGVVELFLNVVVLHGLPPALDGLVWVPAFFHHRTAVGEESNLGAGFAGQATSDCGRPVGNIVTLAAPVGSCSMT
jgi:hypothetical protein